VCPSGRLGRLSGCDIESEGGLQEPASFAGLPLAGERDYPVPDLRPQKGGIRHRIVRATELEQGVAKALGIVKEPEGGTEQVSALILPLAHLEPALGGAAPRGVGGRVFG
jgi:hypothetical protein